LHAACLRYEVRRVFLVSGGASRRLGALYSGRFIVGKTRIHEQVCVAGCLGVIMRCVALAPASLDGRSSYTHLRSSPLW
jgi:hypothetical protein